MASGTGERPLGTPAQEKSLMGLSGYFRTQRETINGSTTRYFTFGTEVYKQGLIIVSGGLNNKDGVYMFGSTSASNFHLIEIKGTSNVDLTVSGTTIAIQNESAGIIIVGIIMTAGDKLPTVSSTLPT